MEAISAGVSSVFPSALSPKAAFATAFWRIGSLNTERGTLACTGDSLNERLSISATGTFMISPDFRLTIRDCANAPNDNTATAPKSNFFISVDFVD